MSDFLARWAGESEANAKLVVEELLIAEVTEAIWQAMENEGCSKTELAKRMGASKGYISQVLNGSRNMTLRTLADICHALAVKPDFHLYGNGQFDGYRTEPQVLSLPNRTKLRYTKVGNTIYPVNAWKAAA